MKAVALAGSMGLLCLLTPMGAAAQSRPAGAFVNLNIGVQEGPQTLSLDVPADVFGGPGTLALDDAISGGNLLDLSGGLRARRFAFGVGFARAASKGAQAFTATTGPLDFSRTWSSVTPDLEHRERMVYLFAGVTGQVSDRFDLMFSGGPAFFTVRRDVPVHASVTDRPIAALIEVGEVEESAVGVVTGLDLNFMVRPRVGIGALVRYSWASVDLPDGTKPLTLGGIQIAAGVRVRL
jgi:hypothetical protein